MMTGASGARRTRRRRKRASLTWIPIHQLQTPRRQNPNLQRYVLIISLQVKFTNRPQETDDWGIWGTKKDKKKKKGAVEEVKEEPVVEEPAPEPEPEKPAEDDFWGSISTKKDKKKKKGKNADPEPEPVEEVKEPEVRTHSYHTYVLFFLRTSY